MVRNSLFLLKFVFAGMSVVMFSSAMSDEQPDYAREDRIVEQIEPDIFDGEAVWLAANGRDFLSIHIEVEQPKGALILMHGRDVNAEEQELINPLRVGLAEQGWTTLSLQLPVLEKGKTYYDYLPILPFAHERIESAIQFLKAQGESKIILVSHSCGVHMANHWLNAKGDSLIDGYIAMGLGATDANQELATPFPIGDMTVPVLDIYGSDEFPRPLTMVNERQVLLKKNGHKHSAQIEVQGAEHYFRGYGEEMVAQLEQWLSGL